LPLDDPPAERLRSQGFSTGAGVLVWLLPEKQRSSQTVFPAMMPPASRMRVTTVASSSGTKPDRSLLPFRIGTPATAMLSLMPTLTPASGPVAAPRMSARQAQAL